jgi:hypothetical protein
MNDNRNKQRILELADFLETAKFKFDMGSPNVYPSCGSAGCIGGHAAALWTKVRDTVAIDADYGDTGRYSWHQQTLADYLGISRNTADRLCYPEDERDQGDDEYEHAETWTDEGALPEECVEYGKITRAGAVATLRRLAETGQVLWYLSEQT